MTITLDQIESVNEAINIAGTALLLEGGAKLVETGEYTGFVAVLPCEGCSGLCQSRDADTRESLERAAFAFRNLALTCENASKELAAGKGTE